MIMSIRDIQEIFDQHIMAPPNVIIITGGKNISQNFIRAKHWRYAQQVKKKTTELVCEYAKALNIPPMRFAWIQMRIYFPDKRRRDMDNYSPKYFVDGLTKAGVIEDDNSNSVFILPTALLYDKQRPRTELYIFRQCPVVFHREANIYGSASDDGRTEATA